MEAIMNNQPLTIVSIADIHFGALNPEYMYNQLKEQFINRLIPLHFDIVAICGDIFDAKYMGNNPIISYALLFMNDLVNLCSSKGATLVLISGTESHDNGQLSLFYHYLGQPNIDIRIVEDIRFEYIKGLKVLCIPEKYGRPEEEYNEVLFNSGRYDLCLLHGTIKGSFKGTDVATLKSNHAPIFGINAFINCAGPILCGHYHTPGCYNEYIYYNGCPLRYQFGQEEKKGFLVTLFNPYDRTHYTELVPIQSYKYTTISIDHIINEDPKKIIDYIKHEKEVNNIDFIRVKFNNANDNMNVVRAYFRNIGNVKFKEMNEKQKRNEYIDNAVLEEYNEYSYILDDSIGDYDKFVMYINQNEGYEFITTDELISILEGDVI